jgi:Phage tail protein (Tail_P2_I)
MGDLQLQPSVSTDLRSQAHLALIDRLKNLDLTPILVYRIPSLVDSAVLPMAWQWDVLNPLLLPLASQLATLYSASWDQVANIDTLTNLDLLQFSLPAESVPLPPDVVAAQYRALILLSTQLHSIVGTPAALQKALTGLGFPGAVIQEGQSTWGGTRWPANQGWAVFRILINLATVPAGTDFTTLPARMVAVANYWKPARCWLDSVQFQNYITDVLIPPVTDSVLNIFLQRDVLTPPVSDSITALFAWISDDKDVVPYYNDRYYFGSNITYGGTQPEVADGPVVVIGSAVPTWPPAQGGGADMFQAASLTGAVNGINPTFTLSPAPTNGVLVFWNGTLLTQGAPGTGQYTLSGSQITFNASAIPDLGIQIYVYVY